jgi:hypothetical protein
VITRSPAVASRIPIERGERVNVAEVGLADRGLDGTLATHERPHFLDARGDLNVVQRLNVVGIGRDDAEGAALRVVEHGKDVRLLRELAGHLGERRRIDLGFRELLGRHETRLVDRGEVLQERDLVDGLHVEQRLFHAVAGARDDVQHRLLVLGGDELLGKQTLEQLVLPDSSHGQG